MKKDIYNYQYSLRIAYSNLERAKIADTDKELVKAFIEHLKAQGVSIGRLAKYIFHLKVIGEALGMEFKKVQRKEIENFSIWLQDSQYTPHTVEDYIRVIKRFYKFVRFWLELEDLCCRNTTQPIQILPYSVYDSRTSFQFPILENGTN